MLGYDARLYIGRTPRPGGAIALAGPRGALYKCAMERDARDTLAAGLAAAVLSGAPSMAWTLARGGDLTEGAKAAGALLLPHERRTVPLLAAAVPTHLAL